MGISLGKFLLDLAANKIKKDAGLSEQSIEIDFELNGVKQTSYYLEKSASLTADPEPAVLLLHGFSSEAEVMGDLVPKSLIPEGARVICLDLPGHGTGASQKDFKGCRHHDLVEYINTFVKAVGLDSHPFHIVGYSMGGALAMMYTTAHAENVDKMVLIAPGLSDLVHPNFDRAIKAVPRDWSGVHCWTTGSEFGNFIKNWCAPPGAPGLPGFIREALAEKRRAMGPKHFDCIFEAFAFPSEEDFEEMSFSFQSKKFEGNPRDALVVWPDSDICIDASKAQYVANALKAEMYNVEDCGHFFSKKMLPVTTLCRKKVAKFLYDGRVSPAPNTAFRNAVVVGLVAVGIAAFYSYRK